MPTPSRQLRPAVFFDRDGTLNEEVGYVRRAAEFRVYPFAAEAVARVNAAGWLAILITNQAGVARGYFTEETVRELNEFLARSLQVAGSRLDAIYYCPHHPEYGTPQYRIACQCRKPNPGMMLAAAREHAIDLARSWVVTDRYREVAMAHAVSARAALVLTGYGAEDALEAATWPRVPDIVAADALAAVTRILSAAPGPAGAQPETSSPTSATQLGDALIPQRGRASVRRGGSKPGRKRSKGATPNKGGHAASSAGDRRR